MEYSEHSLLSWEDRLDMLETETITQGRVFFQDPNPLTRLREINTKLNEDAQIYHSAETYLAKAWNSSPIPMWIKDTNGVMIFVNDAYCTIYDIKKSDYVGKNDFDVWPRQLAEDFRKLDSKVLDGENIQYSIERVPNRAGFREYDHLHVVKFPIKDGPRIVGIAGMITGVFP